MFVPMPLNLPHPPTDPCPRGVERLGMSWYSQTRPPGVASFHQSCALQRDQPTGRRSLHHAAGRVLGILAADALVHALRVALRLLGGEVRLLHRRLRQLLVAVARAAHVALLHQLGVVRAVLPGVPILARALAILASAVAGALVRALGHLRLLLPPSSFL